MNPTPQESADQPASDAPAAAAPAVDRSAAVKDAIRAAARLLFLEHGFEATGIREIAAAAGVNPAIVIRHFGSKEALFVGVVDPTSNWRDTLAAPIDEVGVRVARRIVERRSTGLRPFGAVMGASGRPEIRETLQRMTRTVFAEPLIPRLDGPDARLRAHLFAAQVVGLLTALAVCEDEVLADAPEEELIALYGAGLDRTLRGSA